MQTTQIAVALPAKAPPRDSHVADCPETIDPDLGDDDVGSALTDHPRVTRAGPVWDTLTAIRGRSANDSDRSRP